MALLSYSWRNKNWKNCIIGQNVMIGPDVLLVIIVKFKTMLAYKGVKWIMVYFGPFIFTNVINPRAEVERKNDF